jgi:hypothetical protein
LSTIRINRGTTFLWTFHYAKDDEPASLDGATIRFTVKSVEFSDDVDDSDAVITRDITDGDDDGVASWTLIPADTATLEPGTYFYDIKVKEAGGAVYKIDEGKIRLDGSPTNRLA